MQNSLFNWILKNYYYPLTMHWTWAF